MLWRRFQRYRAQVFCTQMLIEVGLQLGEKPGTVSKGFKLKLVLMLCRAPSGQAGAD